MRHQKKGKKLNRNRAERQSLYKNLVNSLIIHEKIKTTETKAKAVRPVVEKLITEAKKQTLASRRRVEGFLPTPEAARKISDELAERFKERPGGYTRILKLGPRASDRTKMAIIEFLDIPERAGKKEEKDKKKL